MPKPTLNFSWFGNWYKGKVANTFLQLLGVRLEGGEAWDDPSILTKLPGTKAKKERFLCLPGVEALEAVLTGCVRHVVVAGHVVSFEIDARAYANSHSIPGGVSSPVVAGVEPVNNLIYTNQQSTGSRSSSTDGKTELSSFVALLLAAANDYRVDGHAHAKDALSAYAELAAALDDLGELPITGSTGVAVGMRAGTNSVAAAKVRNLARSAVDALYNYACWFRSRAYGAGKASAENWRVEHRAHNTVPGWRAGSPDLASLLTDSAALAGFLSDRQFPRPAAAPAPSAGTSTGVPPGAGSPARAGRTGARSSTPAPAANPPSPFDEVVTGYALTAVESDGGCGNVIITGPPGVGKTTGLLAASDAMPTAYVELDSGMLARDLVAKVEKRADGQWEPVLHDFGAVCRLAMMRSIVIAIRRGGSIDGTLVQYKGHPTAEALAALAANQDDKDALALLDGLANPVYGETWLPVDAAYWESGAPAIGPVYRFVFDEVFDGAGSSTVNTFLKAILAKRRLFKLGIAGTTPLTALNVHICAAGNASASARFQSAVMSRFHGAYALPKPTKDVMVERAKWMIGRAKALTAGKPGAQSRPTDFSLVNHTFEPPVRQVADLTSTCFDQVTAFSEHTCTLYESGKLVEPFDARGVIGTLTLIAHMRGGGKTEKAAFSVALKSVLPKLCKVEPKWGLPVEETHDKLKEKVDELARNLR